MKKSLIALSLLVAASTIAAHAEGPLLWKSAEPTGYVTSGERCYATIRMETVNGNKKRYFNPMECTTPNIHNYVSMSWPLDEPIINMKDIKESHIENARINPNTGMIELR